MVLDLTLLDCYQELPAAFSLQVEAGDDIKPISLVGYGEGAGHRFTGLEIFMYDCQLCAYHIRIIIAVHYDPDHTFPYFILTIIKKDLYAISAMLSNIEQCALEVFGEYFFIAVAVTFMCMT